MNGTLSLGFILPPQPPGPHPPGPHSPHRALPSPPPHPHPSPCRTVPSNTYQGRYAAGKLLTLGLKSALVVYSNGSYGQSLSFAFISSYTAQGGKAPYVPVPMGSRNVSGVLSEIKRLKPQVVFLATNQVNWGAGEEGGVAVLGILGLGFSKKGGACMAGQLICWFACVHWFVCRLTVVDRG